MAETNAMSKKATVGTSGLAIIAAQSDFRTQIILGVLLAIYILQQHRLDIAKIQAEKPKE